MHPKMIVLAILATCGWADDMCSMQGTCPSARSKANSLLQFGKTEVRNKWTEIARTPEDEEQGASEATVVAGKSCSEAGLESLSEEKCEAYCTSIVETKLKGSRYNGKTYHKKGSKKMHHGCALVIAGSYAGDCRFNPKQGNGKETQAGICEDRSTATTSTTAPTESTTTTDRSTTTEYTTTTSTSTSTSTKWTEIARTPVPCKKGEVVKFAPATEPDQCMWPGSNNHSFWKMLPCNITKSPDKEDILFVASENCSWYPQSKPGRCPGFGSSSSTPTYKCGTVIRNNIYGDDMKLMKQTLSDGAGMTKTGLIILLDSGDKKSWMEGNDARCLIGGRRPEIIHERGTSFLYSGVPCIQPPGTGLRNLRGYRDEWSGDMYWKVYPVGTAPNGSTTTTSTTAPTESATTTDRSTTTTDRSTTTEYTTTIATTTSTTVTKGEEQGASEATVVAGKSCSEAGLESLSEEKCEAYCTSIVETKLKGSHYNGKTYHEKGSKKMHHGCVLVIAGSYAGDCRFNPKQGNGKETQAGICESATEALIEETRDDAARDEDNSEATEEEDDAAEDEDAI